MGRCEINESSLNQCCEYGFTIDNKVITYNESTKEVFDVDKNLIGHGEVVIVDGQRIGLNVTLI